MVEPLRGKLKLFADDTLPKLLLKNAQEVSERVAMRKKRYGIWEKYT